MQETQVQSLGREDPLEEETATHSSILAWRIPWTEEPGRLQSMGLPSRTWLSVHAHAHARTHTHIHTHRKVNLQRKTTNKDWLIMAEISRNYPWIHPENGSRIHYSWSLRDTLQCRSPHWQNSQKEWRRACSTTHGFLCEVKNTERGERGERSRIQKRWGDE